MTSLNHKKIPIIHIIKMRALHKTSTPKMSLHRILEVEPRYAGNLLCLWAWNASGGIPPDPTHCRVILKIYNLSS